MSHVFAETTALQRARVYLLYLFFLPLDFHILIVSRMFSRNLQSSPEGAVLGEGNG